MATSRRNRPVSKQFSSVSSAGETHRLAVTYRRIEDLQPNPKNPRQHPPQQIRELKRGIKSFGFNNPVVIDEGSHVICGHGRLAAARELGLVEVPTVQVSHLSESQKTAFSIADNK